MRNTHLASSGGAALLVCLFSAPGAQAQPFNDLLVQPANLVSPARGSILGAYAQLAFGPAELSRGSFTLPSPIDLPSARGGLLFDVLPSYSPENGLSEWGMGWSTSLAIQRQPTIGEVSYFSNEYISPWGRLEEANDGNWYPAGFKERIRVSSSALAGWTAVTGDGTTYEFNRPLATAGGTYAWYLTRVTSLLGDRLEIDYFTNASGQVFAGEIRYGGRDHTSDYRVRLEYDLLAAPFTRYTSGSPLVLDRRVRALHADVRAPGGGPYATRYSYTLGYNTSPISPVFYLSSVTKTFASGAADPTITYTYDFGVDSFDQAAFAAIPGLQPYITSAGGEAIQPTRATLFDLEEDGKPDFEHHYSQTLVHHTDAGWVSEVLPPEPAAHPLCRPAPSVTNEPRLLAQMNGEDEPPHVVRAAYQSATNDTQLLICNRGGVALSTQNYLGNWTPGANVRLVDLNRDRRPDLIRVGSGAYDVLENTSSGSTFTFTQGPPRGLSPAISPNATWVQDMNGDGVADLVVRSGSTLTFWYGTGGLNFVSPGVSLPIITRTGAPLPGLSTYGLSFVDANADGLTDLVLTRNSAAFLFISVGSAFLERVLPGLAIGANMSNPVIADLRGSGNTEINYVAGTNVWGLPLDSARMGLMISTEDGRGSIARFTYDRAPAWDGVGRRSSILASFTQESSGVDPLVSNYDYEAPVLHSVSRALIGFGVVRREGPALVEEMHFYHDDDSSSLPLASYGLDSEISAAFRVDSWTYEARNYLGLQWRRLIDQQSGWAHPTNGQVISERTRYLQFDREMCPTRSQRSNAHGVLTTQTVLATVASLPDSLHCLTAQLTVTGTHADSTLDFLEAAEVTRNSFGQARLVERIGPAGRLTLQDVQYDALNRVSSLALPGQGFLTIKYDQPTGMPIRTITADGVISEILQIDPLTDQVLEMRSERGTNGAYRTYFRYDARERLERNWDDQGGSSQTTPLQTLSYVEPNATRPGSIETRSLVDAALASYRSEVELFTADGTDLGTATRIPQGWAVSDLVSLNRSARSVETMLRDPLSPNTNFSNLTYSTLRPAGLPVVSRTVTTGLGEPKEQQTLVQSARSLAVATSLALISGVLERTDVENGVHTRRKGLDSAGRVLWSDDELGARTTYNYDAQGRLVKVTLADGATSHWMRFDSYGRVARVHRDGVGEVIYTYQPATGLLWRKRFESTTGRPEREVTFAYDASGRVISEIYDHFPTGAQGRFDFEHDGGSISTIPGQRGHLTHTIGDKYRKTVTYNRDGTVNSTRYKLDNWREVEVVADYHAHGLLRSTHRKVWDSSATILESVLQEYHYDARGRLDRITLNGSDMITMVYDGFGRLDRAEFANGAQISMSYDAATRDLDGYWLSNGQQQSGSAWTLNSRGKIEREVTSAAGDTWDREYYYDGRGFLEMAVEPNRTEQFAFDTIGLPALLDDELGQRSIVRNSGRIDADKSVYTLDDLGRVINRDNLTLTYGPLGQISEANTGAGDPIEYFYDEHGERVLKTRGGRPIAGYLAGGYLDDTGYIEPVRIAGRLIGVIQQGNFVLLDTDARGSLIADDKYPARISSFGARAQRPAISAAFDYVEKGYDADLDTVRIGVRDYDPRLGQFWTADPLLFERLEDCGLQPVECNLYSYARNDPIALLDPSGMASTTAQAVWGFVKRMGQHAAHDPIVHASMGPMGLVIGQVVGRYVPAPVRALDADPQAGTIEKLIPSNQAAASIAAAIESEGEGRGAHIADAIFGVKETVETAFLIRGVLNVVKNAPKLLKAGVKAVRGCGTACGPLGKCFVAGTLVVTATAAVAIETLQVGDRVIAHEQCGPTLVDAETWRTVDLAMPSPDGSEGVIHVRALRPISWLEENAATPGAWVEIELEDLDTRGPARVLAVGPAARVEPGEGCVVLATLDHWSSKVLQLRFAGSDDLLEPTARHKLYSFDRSDWVAAEELVAGEQLLTRSGVARIESIARKPGIFRVFNLEVEQQHTYYVADREILAHNNNCDDLVDAASAGARTTSQNAAELAKNMAREGRVVGSGEAAGHIVPSTGSTRHWAAGARARTLLEKYGIRINDAANGIPIGHPRPHNVMHTKAFLEGVETRLMGLESKMREAGYGHRAIRDALRRELRKIGDKVLGDQ